MLNTYMYIYHMLFNIPSFFAEKHAAQLLTEEPKSLSQMSLFVQKHD